jgi:hypothetical protein
MQTGMIMSSLSGFSILAERICKQTAWNMLLDLVCKLTRIMIQKVAWYKYRNTCRRNQYGAYHALAQELSSENPSGLKNLLRMDVLTMCWPCAFICWWCCNLLTSNQDLWLVRDQMYRDPWCTE